jgi:putative endonuclease
MKKVQTRRQFLGKWGEDQVEKYIIKEGLLDIGRNRRTLYGEIDLIAMNDGHLVFIEVKTRSSIHLGFSEESVTEKKYLHLINSIGFYSAEHDEYDDNWRVDVVAVTGELGKSEIDIEWFQNVTP